METHEHKNNIENIELSSSSSSSLSSSPSHEFSFTISQNTTIFPYNNKSKTPPPHSFAVDLSPADDIFFHGHLLPLQILSHFSSSSPRSSTNSMESFTLPIRELFSDENINPTKDSGSSSNNNSANSSTNSSNNNISTLDDDNNNIESNNNIGETKVIEGKSKFNFSLFGSIKGSKGFRVKEKEDKEKKQKQKKKKLRFDVIHVVKKYFRMVPLMIFRGQKGKIRMQSKSYSYSYSGSVTPRNNQELKGWNWRGQYSAPASMRNSPSNSGLLVATTPPFTPPSDSTMEELQAAIQAAIAHCKNSFAKEENLKNANT